MPALMGARCRVPHLMAEGARVQCFVPTMGHLGRSMGAHHFVESDAAWAPAPAVFAMEAHGGRHCGIIYLFAEALSGEGGPAKMHFLGCHRQPQTVCTSSESVELHATKTRLGMGISGQQRAQNSAQTMGKEQAPSSQAGTGLMTITPALASARDGDVQQQ